VAQLLARIQGNYRSIALFFQNSDILLVAAFSNAGGSQVSDVLNDAKFRTLTPCGN